MRNLTARRRYFHVAASIVALLSPVFALAQTVGAKITNCSQLLTFINNIATSLSAIIFALAVIVLIYSAFLFLTGGGNEETVKSARSYLIWAIVGMVVALFAFALPNIVQSIFGSTGTCVNAT